MIPLIDYFSFYLFQLKIIFQNQALMIKNQSMQMKSYEIYNVYVERNFPKFLEFPEMFRFQ